MPAAKKLTRLMPIATLCVLTIAFAVYAQKDMPVTHISILQVPTNADNIVTVRAHKELDESQVIPGPAELRNAGMREYDLGHFVAAQTLLDRAMALAVERSDTYLVALIHDDVGSIYQKQFEFEKADREFMKAADILRGQPEHSVALAITLANRGASLSGERRYREAKTFLAEASKLIKDKAINDPELQVHILNIWGGIYFEEGQLKKAEALFLRSLRMKSPENEIIESADVLNSLGILYARKGDYRKAIASYRRALQVTEERLGPSHPNLTTFLENLGFEYIRMGQYAEAERQFLRSLSILENNGLIMSNMGLYTLNGLAHTYMKSNQLERADPLLTRAVEIGHAIRARTPEMAETLELQSSLLQSLSKLPEAEKLHTEALRIRAELAWTTRAGTVK